MINVSYDVINAKNKVVYWSNLIYYAIQSQHKTITGKTADLNLLTN